MIKLQPSIVAGVAAVVIGSLATHVIPAPTASNRPPFTVSAATVAVPALATTTVSSSRDTQLANLTAAFTALERMPLNLQTRAPSDPEVQAWIIHNIPDPPRHAGIFTVGFGFMCGFAIAQFALGVGLPISKIRAVIGLAGGFRTFIRITRTFLRNGTIPADASAELTDLLLGVTGVGNLSACL